MIAEVADRPHWVYRVRGPRGRLLYIGCTSNIELRRKNHRAHGWHPKAVWEIEGPYSYEVGRQIELAAIHAERPPYNRTGVYVPLSRRNRRLRRVGAA